VAEAFTGTPGLYVKVEDTIRGFKEIVEGKHDDIPERAFYMKGTIEEVLEASRGEKDSDDGKDDDSGDDENGADDENGNGGDSGDSEESSEGGDDTKDDADDADDADDEGK
jgi:hypothetical protein